MTTLEETIEQRSERIAKLRDRRDALARLARDADRQVTEIDEEISGIYDSIIDDLSTAHHTQGISRLS